METTNESQRGRLGGHDGDDDDGDDPVAGILVHLVLTSQFAAACATARLHGMSFEQIRNGFEAQLALMISAENALSSGGSGEDATQAVQKTSAILQQNVHAKADAKKDRS